MARCRLDDQDQRALRKLDDDFVISADGEHAMVSGEMEVEIMRPAEDAVSILADGQISQRRRTRSADSARSSCWSSSILKRTRAEK